jgi:hypothetical protein
MTPIYVETARLLTQIAPLVLVDDTFALKGGTAINLFVRDMPRLSVDLDLRGNWVLLCCPTNRRSSGDLLG